MPGGVPHWVLGTSNAICVGRHFYNGSTIQSSVVAIVHTFLLSGAVTNQEYLKTRTLLYQMLVFWSMRIDKTDVDGGFQRLQCSSDFSTCYIGAHIPDLSSVLEFFDVLYLGVFVTLSPAFDDHSQLKSPPTLVKEAAFARGHFKSLLHFFSNRFIILLEGEPVAHSYVVDRILGEFAAAAVVFAKAIRDSSDEGEDDGNDGTEGNLRCSRFVEDMEGILQGSHPRVFPYYSRCLDRSHKDFLWTGPKVQILPRSDEKVRSIFPLTAAGEMLDHPDHPIYNRNLDSSLQPSSRIISAQVGKNRGREVSRDLSGERPKKRREDF